MRIVDGERTGIEIYELRLRSESSNGAKTGGVCRKKGTFGQLREKFTHLSGAVLDLAFSSVG